MRRCDGTHRAREALSPCLRGPPDPRGTARAPPGGAGCGRRAHGSVPGRFGAVLSSYGYKNRAGQLTISPPRMMLFDFSPTIVDRAREATGTPSDCTAPSTSHNRGPSTAYRCRCKIAFRRCLVVINRPIWPLCHKFCFGTHRSTVESRSGAQTSKVPRIGPD